MAIPYGGTGDYEILVEEDRAGLQPRLIGKGRTTRNWAIHPGFLGYSPDFELTDGLVTLRSSESDLIIRTDHHLARSRPVALASFDLGEALPLVIQGGDILYFCRSDSGDYGFSLLRNNRLILAMGAIAGTFLGPEMEVKEDPRLDDIEIIKHHLWNPGVENHFKDHRLTIVIQNHIYNLQEGEELIANPYYIYFERGYIICIPGNQSILTIAQLSEKLTKETVIKSTKRFTTPKELVRKWE